MIRERCSLCHESVLHTVMTLVRTPIANQFVKEKVKQETFPLELLMCVNCKHVQIGCVIPPKYLFNDYVYATATSKVTITHLYEEAASVKTWHKEAFGLDLGKNSLVIEIGSNDGSMLKVWKEVGVGQVLGIDPAIEIVKKANEEGLETMCGYFNFALTDEVLRKTNGKRADVVVANNVLAHVPDVRDVLEGVSRLLTVNGTFVFEVSHLYDMVKSPLFDTIYHEHMSYHTIGALALVLDSMHMPIRHVERIPNQVGRGSLRVYATPGNGSSMSSEIVRAYMIEEAIAGLYGEEFFSNLQKEIKNRGDIISDWLERISRSGHRIVGYGAPAKMTTLMHTFGLDGDQFEYVVDDSSWKQGLYTPGKHVEIKAPSILKEEGSNTSCFVFAWNFADSIIANNREFKGNWIVPLPELKEYPRPRFMTEPKFFVKKHR